MTVNGWKQLAWLCVIQTESLVSFSTADCESAGIIDRAADRETDQYI